MFQYMVKHVRSPWIFTIICLAYACLPYKVVENQLFLHCRKTFSCASFRLEGIYIPEQKQKAWKMKKWVVATLRCCTPVLTSQWSKGNIFSQSSPLSVLSIKCVQIPQASSLIPLGELHRLLRVCDLNWYVWNNCSLILEGTWSSLWFLLEAVYLWWPGQFQAYKSLAAGWWTPQIHLTSISLLSVLHLKFLNKILVIPSANQCRFFLVFYVF